MAQSSSKKRMPKSVDATGSTPSPWYLDFHLPSGKSDERVLLFFKDKEQSPFKDCGVVKEINKDSSDLDMSPCLGVKVQNGDCYLLEPMAFAWESLKESSDGETMIKAGWIEIKEDTSSENLMDMFTEGFKKVIQYLANLKAQNSKKRKNEGTSQVNQKKALKEGEAPSVGNSTGMVEQESLSLVPLEAPHRDEASLIETPLITPSVAVIADSTSVKVLASIVQPKEKDLDKDVKKTNKSGLDGYIGIEHYFKFGVQLTQLINVDQCNLAPNHFKCRPLSDTTHKGTISSGWSAAQFGKVIDGVCRIAHQLSEFVIVGLVKHQHAASLEKAISEKAKWYELYALPLGYLIVAGTVQPTAFREVTFGVWDFFSQEEQFTNHSSLKESLFQPMSTLGIDDEDEFDALTTAKSFFVRRTIKCICLKEDDKVVDIFSLGYGTKEALLKHRKVVGLVSTPQNDNGKDSENEEIDEPLDAEADAILELLQETGQQDIAIEDVSCEVIGTEDVQAIETTEKDPLNPHLNQIVYKDDDKETQASEALQQNFTVNNVSCEVIDTNDAPAVELMDEESINPHLSQQACKEDDKEIQVSEGQPLQLLETKSSNTMEVDDDASSKTCRRTEEDSTKNILVAQDLSTRVHGDPNLSSNDGPTLTIILSLCGLLLRRCWQKSKKMKSLKFEHEYIVLRPVCIEFLKSLLSISNVGIWSVANDTHVMQIIKILEKEAREQFPFFMIWGQSQCQQCVESRITRPDNPGVEAFFKPLAIASAKFGIDLKNIASYR
ncbi:hypothetical protein L7F22_015273 [Adiantum nelumboides]|nr:hypothetical protein [Adiantum nelumboides]